MRCLVTSFATDDSHYRPHAERLRVDCEQVGIDHDIHLIPPWSEDSQQHCCYKPTFILERLNALNEPLLWIDVDSRIRKPFEIADHDIDIGFCENPLKRKRKHAPNDKTGGAMLFMPTQAARDFLTLWKASCDSRLPGEVADHARMCDLRKALHGGFREGDITRDLAGKVVMYGVRGSLEIPI